MEAETHKLIQTLSKCRFAPATWDKRFVRDMSAKQPDDTLSEKQLLALGTLRYRYSKQILQITKAGMLDHSYGIKTEPETETDYSELTEAIRKHNEAVDRQPPLHPCHHGLDCLGRGKNCGPVCNHSLNLKKCSNRKA